MTQLVLIFQVSAFLSISYVTVFFFIRRPVHDKRRRLLGTLIPITGASCLLARLYSSPLPEWRDLSALVLFSTTIGLLLWCLITLKRGSLHFAFDPHAPQTLFERGPFRLIRHPFYTSYSLSWLASLLATEFWFLLILPILFLLRLYSTAAAEEERTFETGPLKVAYQRYKQRAGRWLPRLKTLFSRG